MKRMCLQVYLVVVVLIVVGCATIGRPVVMQMTPINPIFLSMHPLKFSADDKSKQFSVPAYFVTDLASIPKKLWWWQAPHEGTMGPAIVHDFLYWEQPCSKDEADAIIYMAMMQAGMSKASMDAVYVGLRTRQAMDSWKKNTAAKASGEPRYFTKAYAEYLAEGQANSKDTLATIQAEAARLNGVATPVLDVANIKEVCLAAHHEFQSL